MKQVLIYLVEFLKEQYGMSMSEISKGLGKSRNFIREAITRGYENEEKYKSLIADLRYNFFVNGDYADFFKFMEKKHQESIDSYKVALKQSIESNLEEIDKKNKTISALEHRIVVLSRDVDKGWEKLKEANKNNEILRGCINRKEETIEELIEGKFTVMDQLKEREKSMQALAKAGHSTGASLRKAEIKNRILTGALIGVGLLWAVSVWVMK